MKLLEFDWQALLDRLPVWQGVAPSSRRILQESSPGAPVQLALFGLDGPALIRAKILKPYTDGLRAAPCEEAREFLAMARLLRRAPLLSNPSTSQLAIYIGELFNSLERGGLARSYGPSWGADERLLHGLTLEHHVRGFVEAKDLRSWEAHYAEDAYHAYRRDRPLGPSRFHDPAVAGAAHQLAKLLVERTEPIPVLEMWDALGEHAGAAVARAALGLVRYAVAFLAERPADGVVVLTLWPTIHARLHRKQARAPLPVEPGGERSTAYGVEDIEALLLEVAREPVRIRVQDGIPFEKRRREITAAFRPQGHSVDRFHVELLDGEWWRITFALEHARLFEWVRITGADGKSAYVATEEGRRWLGSAADMRHKHILDALRATPERTPPPAGAKDHRHGGRGDASKAALRAVAPRFEAFEDEVADEDADDVDWPDFRDFAPGRDDLIFLGSFHLTGGFLDPILATEHAVAAFADLPVGQFFDLEEFLRYRSEVLNPLPAKQMGARDAEVSIEEREGLWRETLIMFLHTRLLPFGAAVASDHGPDRRTAFALTSRAAYLFGSTNAWPKTDERHEGKNVVVQPNFEIVFPTPAPGIEARLVAFAERLPARAGTTLRITRASVCAAANAGLDAEGMLQALAEFSLNPIPPNVERELRGWAASSTALEIEEVSIVRCADHDTALRLITAAGNGARLLGETVVELPAGSKLTALLRKVRDAGFFLAPRASPRKMRR